MSGVFTSPPIFRYLKDRVSNPHKMSSSGFASNSFRTFRTTTSPLGSNGRKSGANIFLSQELRVFVQRVEIRELHLRLLHPFQPSFVSTTERRVVCLPV